MKLKKPRFWDNPRPNIYAYLLLPLSILIRAINYFKNDNSKTQTLI